MDPFGAARRAAIVRAAHQDSRAIAAGYSLVGISILFTMVVRNLALEASPLTPWLIVLTKALLAVTLLLTNYRRARLGES